MYWQLVDLVWLCYVPAAVSMTYRVAKNWNKYEKKVDMQRRFHSPNLCFLITTKRCGKVVQETIDAVHKAAKELEYEKYSVRVVADSIDNPCTNAEVQVVPASYKSVGKHKARALQYALESIPSDENTWIFHLDEESVMTTQCFQASLEYIVDGGKPIAEGPINYPNDIRNIFTLFLEGERSISCFYCVDQMENTPIWLHGSNLLVRSDVEHKVGWQFGDSLAEDQRFAYEAESKIGKDAFGWHGGLLLEKPAFSIKDAIKQRKRWFAGSLQNLST
jgi:cellulose synthase/poly-beta-1,6-N-acetylglucosamine synthase-like glycosyltransferase